MFGTPNQLINAQLAPTTLPIWQIDVSGMWIPTYRHGFSAAALFPDAAPLRMVQVVAQNPNSILSKLAVRLVSQ
jgi:hypothetical protein